MPEPPNQTTACSALGRLLPAEDVRNLEERLRRVLEPFAGCVVTADLQRQMRQAMTAEALKMRREGLELTPLLDAMADEAEGKELRHG
jgi:hypothetical protein